MSKKDNIQLTSKERKELVQQKHDQRYRVQFDFGYKGVKGKAMDQEVITQPDMSLTVRQLLENHTRGVGSNVKEHAPIYFDIEVPTIKDLTDVQEYKEHLERKLKETTQFIKDEDERLKAEKKSKQKQLDLEEAIKNEEDDA